MRVSVGVETLSPGPCTLLMRTARDDGDAFLPGVLADFLGVEDSVIALDSL